MVKPKSIDKKVAIISSATHAINKAGVKASTASIAKDAGIATGSLFTYFSSKDDLINQLYISLKTEMAHAALANYDEHDTPRQKLLSIWTNWVKWAAAHPSRHGALLKINASKELSAESRKEASMAMVKVADVLKDISDKGPMGEVSMDFLIAVTNSLAETTMNFMISDTKNAEVHLLVGFNALYRALTN